MQQKLRPWNQIVYVELLMYFLHINNSRNVERTKLIIAACLLNLKRSGHTKLALSVDLHEYETRWTAKWLTSNKREPTNKYPSRVAP
jgi:hypothetical protein